MDFENRFDGKAPIAEVYDAMMDVPRVVVCMPGAELLGPAEADSCAIGVKVKLGPMSMNYRGELEILERDRSAYAATMRIKAREVRGQGTATAEVRMRLQENAEMTHATVNASVALAGRTASMGRGIIQDVSRTLVQEFAENLAVMLEGGGPAAVPAISEDGASIDAGRGDADAHSAAPFAERLAGPQSKLTSSGEFRALPLATRILADRVRDPRVALAAFGGALVVGYWLGAHSRR